MNLLRGIRCTRAAAVLASMVVAGICVGSQAHAQTWLPDRAYTEGPGIRAGDLEIHPGVAVRGGYDSNVFRADGERRDPVIVNGRPVDVSQRREGSGILAVTPHIHLSTLSAQRKTQGEDREAGAPAPVAFRGGIAATYFHYFVDDGPRNLEIDTDLALSILPQRPFNVDLTATYVRSVRPFTQNAGLRNAFVYDTLSPRARFNFGSRSQVLTGYVGYAPRLNVYESDVFNYLNSFTHGAEAGAAWKFLPNTAFIYDAILEFQNYQKTDPFNTASPIVFADNKRFRTRLGINGALTRTLSLRVLAGYALMAFNDGNDGSLLDDHEDVVGEPVFAWGFGPGKTSKLELGYNRDLVSSALGGWTRLDRGSLAVRSLLGGVFLLSLEGGIAKITYGDIWGYDRATGAEMAVAAGANNTVDRNDIRADGAVRGEYRVTNWLSFMADVTVQAVITDFDYALYVANQANPVPDPARYFAVVAFGGVRAHY